MCNCNKEKEQEGLVTRRSVMKNFFIIAGGVVLSLFSLVTNSKKAEAGYGRCSMCNCPQFYGNGNQCSNCGHSYGAHW
jgi:hypothetical protein